MRRSRRKLFQRKVDKYIIEDILREFIKPIKFNMIIHFEVTRRGVVKLYSDCPGILIGKAGKSIEELTRRMKAECNVKDVKVYEMHYIRNDSGDLY